MRRPPGATVARGLALAVALACASAAAGCGGSGEARDAGDGAAVQATTTTAAAPATSAPTTGGPAPAAGPLAGAVVVVDPGHNGANGTRPDVIGAPVDAGGFTKACNTTGTETDAGVSEASINWAVAQLLRDRLAAAGAEVVLTRDSDDGVGPCIDERARTAADRGAAALVSLHADGAPAAAHGFHVIHPAVRPGYTDGTAGPSAELAADVRDALVAGGFAPSDTVGAGGLVERDDLGTLNLAGAPAVMVEAGNLRNAGDAATLTSPDGQARLADALASAVVTFLAP